MVELKTKCVESIVTVDQVSAAALMKEIQDRIQADGWVYLTQENRVLFGKWKNDTKEFVWPAGFTFELPYVKELAIFAETWECKVTRCADSKDFLIRYIEDATEKASLNPDSTKLVSNRIMDQKYLLYGTAYENQGEWTKAREQSGGVLDLPYKASGSERIWIRVRDYFTVNEPLIVSSNGSQDHKEWKPSDGISFTDRRLCAFVRDNGETINGRI